MTEIKYLTHSALVLALFALGCGSDGEGTRAPELKTVPTEASVLADINEQVGDLKVDGERLFWLGTPEKRNYYGAALRSCDKRDCVNSLVTYDGSRAIPSTSYGIGDGEVYWFRLLDDEPPGEWALLACPVAGCSGSPRVVWSDRSTPPQSASFGDRQVFIADNAIYRMPLPNGGRPEFVVRGGSNFGYVERADYVYWLENHSLPDLTSELALYRARIDGSTLGELLVDHIDPPFGRFGTGLQFASRALATTETEVYWAHGGLTGGIARCALDGCGGVPEEILPRVRSPGALRLDGGQLFFQHQGLTGSMGLSACFLEHCLTDQRAIASGLVAANAIAFDDDFVYTATGDVPEFGSGEWLDPSAKIRRFPRPR